MGDTSYSQMLSAQRIDISDISEWNICRAGCMKADLAYPGDNRGRLRVLLAELTEYGRYSGKIT